MAERDRDYLPRVFQDLRAEHPGMAEAYDNLGDACRRAGPLSEREQRLVKLGIAVGLSSEGAVRSHVRWGLDEELAELTSAAGRDWLSVSFARGRVMPFVPVGELDRGHGRRPAPRETGLGVAASPVRVATAFVSQAAG